MSKPLSKTALELAKGVFLPRDVVTQKINILGQSGGGKTYTGMKLAELMLAQLAQIVVIDLVGVWWGLLSSADGQHAGFPVTVIGGEHGHLPITPGSGAMVADLVVDRGISVDYISALAASGCADARAPRGGPWIAGHALFMGDR